MSLRAEGGEWRLRLEFALMDLSTACHELITCTQFTIKLKTNSSGIPPPVHTALRAGLDIESIAADLFTPIYKLDSLM